MILELAPAIGACLVFLCLLLFKKRISHIVMDRCYGDTLQDSDPLRRFILEIEKQKLEAKKRAVKNHFNDACAGQKIRRSNSQTAQPVRCSIDPGLRNSLRRLGLNDHVIPSEQELRRAWKVVAKRSHPDAGGSNDALQHAKTAYDDCRRYIATQLT